MGIGLMVKHITQHQTQQSLESALRGTADAPGATYTMIPTAAAGCNSSHMLLHTNCADDHSMMQTGADSLSEKLAVVSMTCSAAITAAPVNRQMEQLGSVNTTSKSSDALGDNINSRPAPVWRYTGADTPVHKNKPSRAAGEQDSQCSTTGASRT